MERAHDLGDALGTHLAKRAEHKLAGLVLPVRKVELVAGSPPEQAHSARELHHAVGKQVGGKEGSGLPVDARAVVVEHRDLLDVCGSAWLHAPIPSLSECVGDMIAHRGSGGVNRDTKGQRSDATGIRKRALRRGPSSSAMAGCKGLEPSTSDVTGRRSNQLS